MATVGLTAILVDGKIFLTFRERLENRVIRQEERLVKGGKPRRTWSGFLLGIITCYQCCGFWSGLFCGLFFTVSRWASGPFWAMLDADAKFIIFLQLVLSPFFWFLCGLVGSFLATVYLMLVELIFAKTMLCRRTNPELPPEGFAEEEPPVD